MDTDGISHICRKLCVTFKDAFIKGFFFFKSAYQMFNMSGKQAITH